MSSTLPGTHPVPETEKTFAELGLSPAILRCLTNVGFTHPTPVQAQTIPVAMQGRDLIVCAQTGTGKTAAFVIPIAERLVHDTRAVRGVILCPTREIAQQSQAFIELFGQDHKLTSTILIGGVKIGPQITALRHHPDIVVATPGRLLDHLERKTITLEHVTELVFDEADRMLDMGFLPQINALMRQIPRERHTMMFSATMPFAVADLARRFLDNPQRIDVSRPGTAAEGIEHRLYLVDAQDKRKLLQRLFETIPGSTLVFTRMKRDADRMAHWIETQLQIPVACLHADRTQSQRTTALQDFRDGKFRVMVATDIAARGLDIPQIAHVIHFDVPGNPEDYVHRSGRTARYEATGIASLIGSWMDKPLIDAIEKLVGNALPRCTVEGVEPYVERKATRTIGRPLRSARRRFR